MPDSGFLKFKLDYSKTKDLDVSDMVDSENFSTGEHIWRVSCYPHGDEKENNGEYISLFLELMGESKSVKAIFDVFVMGKDGEPSSTVAKRCVHVYPPKGWDSWGWPKFVKQSDLESLYVLNHIVRFMCVVIVLRDNPIPVPSSNIGSHLGSLLDRTDGTDVSFVVAGETFHAHRVVLAARSPVFRAELFGSMVESKMSRITLQDMEPSKFRALLWFIYTDEFPGVDGELGSSSPSTNTTEVLQTLLAAADMYDLSRLKLMCAQKLWEVVTVDNIATMLSYAKTHSCPELKRRCLEFFVVEKNFRKVVLTEGYLQLMQCFPSVIDEIRAMVES